MMDILGLHGRNAEFWPETDFEAIRYIRPRWLKMMSHTGVSVFERIRAEMPDIKFVTRLYDGGAFGTGRRRPESFDFADRMSEHIRELLPYCNMFEIHNEPNHKDGIEGWGDTEDDAKSFTHWYINVLNILRSRFPTIRLGFPGLAAPHFLHRDRMWLEICKPAIELSHFLCCHSYWQSPPDDDTEYWQHPDFGLNFQFYHSLYKKLPIVISEAGNSNCQNNYPLNEDDRAWQYGAWFRKVAEVGSDYVLAACPFILSSPDKTWDGFCLLDRDGTFRPVIHTLANLKNV